MCCCDALQPNCGPVAESANSPLALVAAVLTAPCWLPRGCRVFGNAPGCPNCCFLKAASGWSRQPSAALTAGTVPGRGAPAQPPSPAEPPAPAPSPPPAPATPPSPSAPLPGPSGSVAAAQQQCNILPRTNLQGLVVSTSSEPDEGACCQRCRAHPTCNAFVYCPQPGG